jgi:hypothetical protein
MKKENARNYYKVDLKFVVEDPYIGRVQWNPETETWQSGPGLSKLYEDADSVSQHELIYYTTALKQLDILVQEELSRRQQNKDWQNNNINGWIFKILRELVVNGTNKELPVFLPVFISPLTNGFKYKGTLIEFWVIESGSSYHFYGHKKDVTQFPELLEAIRIVETERKIKINLV